MSNLKISPSVDPSPFVVRPVRRDEMDRWRALMRQHHYLGFERIVGKSLFYVATKATQWVALLGWGSAALKCAARDQWIGWEPALQFKRLHLIANNVRFLILPDWHIPNLASHLLALNLKRLSQDWQLYHGHPILLAETFVAKDKQPTLRNDIAELKSWRFSPLRTPSSIKPMAVWNCAMFGPGPQIILTCTRLNFILDFSIYQRRIFTARSLHSLKSQRTPRIFQAFPDPERKMQDQESSKP